ncbi:Uncharacterised protein [Lelliottia amnigena]|nr:hypothetical protein CCAJJPOJ_04019 [Lelliottia sp. T2.26D-8]VDZ90263.1 Uncharacterised protein [Lelliottia amnigena]
MIYFFKDCASISFCPSLHAQGTVSVKPFTRTGTKMIIKAQNMCY